MDKNTDTTSLLHDFNQGNSGSIFSTPVIIVLFIVAFLGIATGYLMSQNGGKVGNVNVGQIATGGPSKGTIEGSSDTSTFKDTTEGVLKMGGIEGEGQYHLVRPGGDSQNVYMTSSLVDLSKYLGKKIKVWGETQKAQHAGWLMDVGRVEVL